MIERTLVLIKPDGVQRSLVGEIVGTIVFTKEQKLCFMIKNKEVADSYKDYFNLLWKQAIKTGK